MFFDVISFSFLAASTVLFQIIGISFLLFFFKLKDTSTKKTSHITPEIWAWGRVTGWLIVGLVVWVLGHFIPVNTDIGFWGILASGFGILAFHRSLRLTLRSFLRTHTKDILLFEALFLAGFIFLGVVRTYNPQVLDLEKFMDAGLMQRYLTSPTLPIEDMWLSGESINYYTFGHFLGSIMLRFWLVPVEWGYNPLLGYILGLMCIESFALARVLLRPFLGQKKHQSLLLIITGFLALFFVNFGGNSHPVWYLLKNKSFEKYWYPDATRFIERTIHEFPAYSYIVSDLHAHVWSMPIVLLFLFIAWQWMQSIVEESPLQSLKLSSFRKILTQPSLKEGLVLGILLGVLAMTSTWDMMIYGIFLAILGVFLLVIFWQKISLLIASGIAAGLGLVSAAFLWWWNFTSISQGVFWVYERSPLWQLGVLWGGHVLLSFVALVIAGLFFKRSSASSRNYSFLFLVSIGLTAFLLLLLPEVIYFKDIYPNHPRANTMFKFTFQAFILMGFLVSWLMGFMIQSKNSFSRITRSVIVLVASLFFLSVMTYPFLGFKSYYGQFKTREGWNGLSWLMKENPADYKAVLWLRKEAKLPAVVLEAVGESYSKKARVSTFTGIPTVLGWRVHEWLWRGGFSIPGQRTDEVKMMYEKPFSPEAQQLFQKYKVKYIFIGSLEKEVYQLNTIELLQTGSLIYSEDGVFIIQRNP